MIYRVNQKSVFHYVHATNYYHCYYFYYYLYYFNYYLQLFYKIFVIATVANAVSVRWLIIVSHKIVGKASQLSSILLFVVEKSSVTF